jgi:hypothetical protein
VGRQTAKSESRLRAVLEPRAIIFGLTLAIFAWTWVRESRIDWASLDYHGTYENTFTALWLLVASLTLLLGRYWSYPISLVAGGRVFYMTGYLPLWIYANFSGGGGPLSSPGTWKNWLRFTLSTQPQYILHATVGATIFAYAAFLLSRQLFRRSS